MIELTGVSKRYGDTQALASSELRFPGGMTSALMGSSGSGKSTVLRLILGLIEADSGRVLIGDVELTPTNALELRRRVGYVVQDGGLFPHLTAKGNALLLARSIAAQSESSLEARCRELAALVQLPIEKLERYPAELSGGERQRVGLIRALMLDPEVLLLDEPLSALDVLVRADLQTDLRGIFDELGKTVVLVTHDIDEAAYFGERLILMHQGRVVQAGSFEELRDQPADPFVTRFLGARPGREA